MPHLVENALIPIRRRCASQAAQITLFCCLSLLFGPALGGEGAAQSSQGRDLTVKRIYSAPSLSGTRLNNTVWSPDGKWLSYLDGNAKGGAEIGAVDAATGRRQTLVDADHLRNVLLPAASRGQQTGLGRVAPSRYLWSPDSRALLFISAEELFWYDLKSQTSRLLASPAEKKTGGDAVIDDVQISPDGRSAAFIRDHDLWVVNVAGGPARQITTGTSFILTANRSSSYWEALSISRST